MPKISIITIAYNNKEGLEKTIRSVISQTYQDFEFLVIDGGSTDGSAALLEQYKSQIDYCVSEQDSGIYNAMNKGILASKGEYLLFLNSGDFLAGEDILLKISHHFTGEDIVYGNAYYEVPNVKRYEYKIPSKITLGTLLRESICHQSAFFRKDFMLENGMYDENYSISSDHIFNLKVFIQKTPTQKHIPDYISVFDKSGISCTQSDKAQREVQEFLGKTLSKDLQKMALNYDKYQSFYENKTGKLVRNLKEKYWRIRYGK